MPTIVRSGVLDAPPKEVWRTIGDPHQLARWWPKVLRVEGVGGGRFTEVLQTDSGREVRADFTIVEQRSARIWRAAQELEGTPFEGILARSEIEVALEPGGADGTRLTITLERRMKGVARFGGFLMRRGTARQIEDALENLEVIHGAGS